LPSIYIRQLDHKSQTLKPKHEKRKNKREEQRWAYRKWMRTRSRMLGGFIRDRVKDDSGEIRHKVD
jgi:hypothetical protein